VRSSFALSASAWAPHAGKPSVTSAATRAARHPHRRHPGPGRAAGETAPILFTVAAFYLPNLPSSLFDQTMALPYHLYVIATQVPGMPLRQQYARRWCCSDRAHHDAGRLARAFDHAPAAGMVGRKSYQGIKLCIHLRLSQPINLRHKPRQQPVRNLSFRCATCSTSTKTGRGTAQHQSGHSAA